MAEARKRREPLKKSQKVLKKRDSWGVMRSFFSCKYHQTALTGRRKKKLGKIGCSGSLCKQRESSRITQRPESNSPDACNVSSRSLKAHPSNEFAGVGGKNMRRLSGCYECQLVVDTAHGVSRDASLRTPTLFSCSECEEIFKKADSLELHQSVTHAVSELGAEETSRKIVEIIFQSSWLKRQTPICNIERILKINNTKKTIACFEDYRNSIKAKANSLTRKNSRCIADGNELLRFHCTSLTCSLGLNGSTNLCQSIPHCEVCSIMREGFKGDGLSRIRTMATSGRADDLAKVVGPEMEKAMLVCRVIAGRMRKSYEALDQECDSVAGVAGVYSNLDELFVFDSRAILPCFVVIYKVL